MIRLRRSSVGKVWRRSADHLDIRETVRESLKEVKAFWQDKSLWPTITPVEIEGLPVAYPDDPVYTVSGTDIETQEDFEELYLLNVFSYYNRVTNGTAIIENQYIQTIATRE